MNQFPSSPTPCYPLSIESSFKVITSEFENGSEQRRQVWTFPKRSLTLNFERISQTDTNSFYSFFNQQRGGLEAFYYYLPLKENENWPSYTNEYVGKGDGSTVVFELPSKETSSPVTGSILSVNGDFETDPTVNWSVTNGTIASVAGGVSGNCLQLTRTVGGGQWAYQTPTLVVGKSYKLSGYVKSGSSGNENFSFGIADNAFSVWVSRVQGISSSAWTYFETVFTATETNSHINLQKDTATAGTMLFDRVKLYEVSSVGLSAYVNGALDGGVDFLSGGGDAGVDRIQFDRAPANGSMITADFTGQLRLRLRFANDTFKKELVEFTLYNVSAELKEVRA